METLTLVQKILIAPKYLDANIETHIYRQLEKILKGKSTQEHGYIVDIDREIKILDNSINSDASVLYQVEFKVNTLKPRKGHILEGVVIMVFENGIFVEVLNEVKVLVPLEKIGKYKYVSEKKIFKYKKKTISVGDIIRVKLDLIQYEGKTFSCIAFLEV